ncbi:hypothetical protein DV735_g5066, partial [Chaetothyriales sp. CBS 134920]
MVDASLDELNPAAFELLVGSAGKSQQSGLSPSRFNYPVERKERYDRASKHSGPPAQKRTIPAPRGDDDDSYSPPTTARPPEMSFVEVTQSQVFNPGSNKTTGPNSADTTTAQSSTKDEADSVSMAARVLKNERLFSILSSHSDIDHPICSECTSLLLQSYTARLAAATRERDAYAGFLKQLQQNAAAGMGEDDSKAEKELADLQKEDEERMKELLALEKEKAELEAELADLEEESKALGEEEQAFWASRNAFDEEMHLLNTELASLQLKFLHDEQQLEKLQRTNVYNDAFCIGHDGSFATINGLRLGRLPGHNVEWAEINAGWGQTLLLLATVAERLGYEFQGYRLRPMGSTSRIEKLEYPQRAPSSSQSSVPGNQRSRLAADSSQQPKVTSLELFSSGEIPLARLRIYNRFDNGLAAFLDCLAQLGDYVDKLPAGGNEGRLGSARAAATRPLPKAVFPYRIQGDRIGNDKSGFVSIKLGVGFQQQQDENFTRACKYALTCCKFLLAHLSALDSGRAYPHLMAISDFEAQRLANIAERNALLKQLNLQSKAQAVRERVEFSGPRRTSSRLAGIQAGSDQAEELDRAAREAAAAKEEEERIQRLRRQEDIEFEGSLVLGTDVLLKGGRGNVKALRARMNKLALWDAFEPARLKVVPERIYSMHIHPTQAKPIVFVGDKVGNLGILDAKPHADADADEDEDEDEAEPSITTIKPHTRTISAMHMHPSKPQTLYTASYDSSIRATDLHKSLATEVYGPADPTDDEPLSGIDMADSNPNLSDKKIGGFSLNPLAPHYLATASLDRTMKLWDLRRITTTATSDGDGDGDDNDNIKLPTLVGEHLSRLSVSHAAFNAAGQVATTSYDDTIKIHSFGVDTSGGGMTAWPAGRTLDDAAMKPEVVIRHNNQTGRWVTILRPQWQRRPTDGIQKFAIGNMNRFVDVYAADGSQLAQLGDDENRITAVPAVAVWHESNEWVAGGNASGKVCLWV